MPWKEIIYALLEICLGNQAKEAEFKQALKNSPPRQRLRFARRARLKMLLNGSSLSEVRESDVLIVKGQFDDDEINEIWDDYSAWKAAKS